MKAKASNRDRTRPVISVRRNSAFKPSLSTADIEEVTAHNGASQTFESRSYIHTYPSCNKRKSRPGCSFAESAVTDFVPLFRCIQTPCGVPNDHQHGAAIARGQLAGLGAPRALRWLVVVLSTELRAESSVETCPHFPGNISCRKAFHSPSRRGRLPCPVIVAQLPLECGAGILSTVCWAVCGIK